MKQYKVVRPFVDLDKSFKRTGDTVTCDDSRAALLRRFGKIGLSVEIAAKSFPDPITIVDSSPEENSMVDESRVETRRRGRPKK